MPTKKYMSATLTDHLSMSPPPCRMALVVAYAYGENPEERQIHTYPVVAIRSHVTSRYVRYRPDGDTPRNPVSHDDAIENGWRPEHLGQIQEHDVLVIADVDGADAIYPMEEILSDSPRHYRLVMCDWSPDQDRERFEAIGRDIVANPDETTASGNKIVITPEPAEAP